jgi:hypothetical protein
MVCEAGLDMDGEPALVYATEWIARAVAVGWRFLGAMEFAPYRCVTAGHIHLCPAGLVLRCPVCFAGPGMACMVPDGPPGHTPTLGAAPHPERLNRATAGVGGP